MDFVHDALRRWEQLPVFTVVDQDRSPSITAPTSYRALEDWAYQRGVRKLDVMRPGKPVENASIESFNDGARRVRTCTNSRQSRMRRRGSKPGASTYDQRRPQDRSAS